MTERKSLLSNLNYFRWKKFQAQSLLNKAQIALTSRGKVEYVLEGSKGPVIVAIHGEPGNIFQCSYIFAGLKSRNFRYLAWSRPGYLGTPLSSGRTICEQSDLLCALLDFLGIDKVALIGFSYGGLLAMDFAISYPQRTYAIILDGSVAKRISYTRSFFRYMVNFFAFSDMGNWISSIAEGVSETLSTKSLIQRFSSFKENRINELIGQITQDDEMYELIRRSLIEAMKPFSLNAKGFKNDSKQYHRLDSLEFNKIMAPTLIIHGMQDAEVPFEHGLFLSRTITGAQFLPLKDACHFTLITHEDETTKSKFSFLNKYVLEKGYDANKKSHSKRYYNEIEKNIFAVVEKIADADESVLLVDAIEIYPVGSAYHVALIVELSSRLNLMYVQVISDRLKLRIKKSLPGVLEVFIQAMPNGYFASTIKNDTAQSHE